MNFEDLKLKDKVYLFNISRLEIHAAEVTSISFNEQYCHKSLELGIDSRSYRILLPLGESFIRDKEEVCFGGYVIGKCNLKDTYGYDFISTGVKFAQDIRHKYKEELSVTISHNLIKGMKTLKKLEPDYNSVLKRLFNTLEFTKGNAHSMKSEDLIKDTIKYLQSLLK